MKLVAIGGGNYSLNDAEKPYNLEAIDNEIVKLANKKCPRLLYLGFNIRADYYFSNIKKIFMAKGCQCEYLRFSDFDNQKTVENKFKRADIIFLPGGNTLDYMKKIRKFGLGDYIKLASERGAVLAGISAGAIIYFETGCSDSRKSETFPKKYTKVNGLGIFNGLIAPHFSSSDRVYDLPRMLNGCKASTIAFGIDECASLVIDGEKYRVIKSQAEAKVFKCCNKNGKYNCIELLLEGEVKDLYQK